MDQSNFSGGLNANSAADKVQPNEVVLAQNIDFGLEEGALSARRGSVRFSTLTGGSAPVRVLWRSYSNPTSIDSGAWAAAAGTSVLFSTDASVWAEFGGSAAYTDLIPFSQWQDDVLFANGPTGGGLWRYTPGVSSAREWVLQAPQHAPNITLQTLAPLVVSTVWTVSEGTLDGNGTSTATATTSMGATYRIQFNATPLSTNMSSNSGEVIGDYGVDFISLACNKPSSLVRVTKDFSIGDSSFSNYFHSSLDLGEEQNAIADALLLAEVQLQAGVGTATSVDLETRERVLSELQLNPRTPSSILGLAAGSFGVWATPRPSFSFVGRSVGEGWANIQACRIIIEASEEVIAKITSWDVRGAESYPLNDPDVGYVWYETWGVVDGDNRLIAESAPGPSSARTKALSCRALVVSTASNTGVANSAGVTHRFLYRQGGATRDAYLVSTLSQTAYATATWTDTIGEVTSVAGGVKLPRNIYSRGNFPPNIALISKPYMSRVFVAHENYLMWSLPGQPDSFPFTSFVRVSHSGDEIKGLVVAGDSLIVICRDSVFEFRGGFLESETDFLLSRLSAKRGSKCPRTIIETPHGVPILDYDGLYFYTPGYPSEQLVEWVQAKIGDAWRGTGASDPSTLKGTRVPPINKSYIITSWAVWAEGRLYLAVPTASSQTPNTLFVLDFSSQTCMYYTYPFNFTCGFWDQVDNRLLVGTTDGKLMRLEIGLADQDSSGVGVGVSWRVKTRVWSFAQDVSLTDSSVDLQGTATLSGIVNSTTTVALGTRSSASRQRHSLAPTSSGVQLVEFDFKGTQSASRDVVYNIAWNAQPEPQRVTYARTPLEGEGGGEFEWRTLEAELDCLGGTATASYYIDSTYVGSCTFSGNGWQGYVHALPIETFGRTGYVVYTGGPFKLFKSWFGKTPEPPEVNRWRTPTISQEAGQWLETWVCVLNPGPTGTCTGTLRDFNGTTIQVATFTGTRRHTFEVGLDVDASLVPSLKQTTLDVVYTGNGFKHYDTQIITSPTPPSKKSFQVTYHKLGGASQIDMVRFWQLDVETPASTTATITSVWDVDNKVFGTTTLTHTGGRKYYDRQPLPSGGRGYLVRQRMYSSVDFQVWHSSLDGVREGVKYFARQGYTQQKGGRR